MPVVPNTDYRLTLLTLIQRRSRGFTELSRALNFLYKVKVDWAHIAAQLQQLRRKEKIAYDRLNRRWYAL